MEDKKMESNEAKNESEVVETTNPYILELCDDQGNKKIVSVLPVANFTELVPDIYANLDNTCMSSRVLFDQLNPLKALRKPAGFHPISQEKFDKLEFENKQILTFFGYPSDFFERVERDIEYLCNGRRNVTKFIKEYGSGKVKVLNSFFLGEGDNDFWEVYCDLKNNIISNFVKGTYYEFKNNDYIEKYPHRVVTDGRNRIYLPTFINETEAPRFDGNSRKPTGGSEAFWINMDKILGEPVYKKLEASDLDFIENLINYDEFSTKKEEGRDDAEYFAISEPGNDSGINLCKGARDLVDNILKSEECKSLIDKGCKISEDSIRNALMHVSVMGCETTLLFPKIAFEESEPKKTKLSLDERKVSARKDFLDAIKEQIAKEHKVRLYGQKIKIWDWEDELVNNDDDKNKYSPTNYWQAVISSVFLKFRNLGREKREIIFCNFICLYENMRFVNQGMYNYFSGKLKLNSGCKTPILIEELLKNTDLSLSEKDWSDLAGSIVKIFEMLEHAEHVTQIIFFERLEFKDKFNDLFFVYNNKLIIQIPELVKIIASPYECYKYKHNCLVDKGLILLGNLGNSDSDISKISKFKFHYDGLPYISGISRESLKMFIDNFEREYTGFTECETGKVTFVENDKEYYLGIGSYITKLKAKEYISCIMNVLARIDIDRLNHLISILPENFWSKTDFINSCFSVKNGFGTSYSEKIFLIIKIAIKIAEHDCNLNLLDEIPKFLLTPENISCSLISDLVRMIFDEYSQKVSDYEKITNENHENHDNIECVLSYSEYSYLEKLSGPDNTVKLIPIVLNGHLLEIKNSTSEICLFVERKSSCMYDVEDYEQPVKIVLDGNKLSLKEVNEPIKLDTSIIPGLEDSFKIASIKLEMDQYKTLFIKFLKGVLSNNKSNAFESINNFLIEKNKYKYDVLKSMISEKVFNDFSEEERNNLFNYFSCRPKKILENLDYCFVKWYIGKLSDNEIIEKIILETRELPCEIANERLNKLIELNSNFSNVSRKMKFYRSVSYRKDSSKKFIQSLIHKYGSLKNNAGNIPKKRYRSVDSKGEI